MRIGAIEQDADVVIFLSSPDYQREATEIDPFLRRKIDVKIAKHCNGDLVTIPLDADLSTQRFCDPTKNIEEEHASKLIRRMDADRRFQIETPTPIPEDDD